MFSSRAKVVQTIALFLLGIPLAYFAWYFIEKNGDYSSFVSSGESGNYSKSKRKTSHEEIRIPGVTTHGGSTYLEETTFGIYSGDEYFAFQDRRGEISGGLVWSNDKVIRNKKPHKNNINNNIYRHLLLLAAPRFFLLRHSTHHRLRFWDRAHNQIRQVWQFNVFHES